MKQGRNTFLSLMDIVKRHKLKGKRLALNIDCEGCEYNGLKPVPLSFLDNVDVIIGELHFIKLHSEEWGMLDIFRFLTDKFVVVNIHMSNYGCMPNRKLALHPLNKVLQAGFPDCQQK